MAYTATIRALSSSTITGTEVVNAQGENLGNVEDLMIDLSSGRILYAVLSFGGILGIADKLFAVPFEAIVVDTEDEKFVLDVPQERLKEAPGFDKNNWPSTPDQAFYDEVYSYYSIQPWWNV